MPYADSDYERSWKMHTTGVTLRPLKPECPTPGPWYCHVQTAVAEESDGEYGAATCITTADAGSYSRTGNRGDVIAWVPHDRKHGPNARLIAAAPEMLATLKRMREVFEQLSDGDWRHMDATYVDQLIDSDGLLGCDQAITKATAEGP